ncbi:unnamed protein product [Paramecium sonneborni]|uniref:WD domain, G-beta repeat protein n=1 Tax=Paramecium sonneborni TaxID=65129 RepID=A0A8S1M0R7_9CILI|nr:unnamed protein product [Paramecium sonneborni]
MQIRCAQIHHENEQIIGVCINKQCQYQRLYCNLCFPNHILHLNELKPFEELQNWIQSKVLIINDLFKEAQECKLIIDSLFNLFAPYLKISVEQFLGLGIKQINCMIQSFNQIKACEQTLFILIKSSFEQIKSLVYQIKKKLKNQANFKENVNIPPIQQLNSINIDQPKCISTLEPNLTKLNFQIMSQHSIKQNENCQAIAFNKDCSILIAGSNEEIKVYKHLQGKLNQIQVLNEHKSDVYTLNFMNKTNNFISGSCDNSIIIWQMNQDNQWNLIQKLNDHSSSINCLLLNNNDDIIISGSYKDIKFWMKQKTWLCQQTITVHTDSVFSLSLNEHQNQLISCSQDNLILIIGQSQLNKKWSVIQMIKVDQFGFRLCFINHNLFAFQPYLKEQLYIYEIESHSLQFRKTKEVEVKCGLNFCNCFFPLQYIKSKYLLVNKNGKYVNIIMMKQNGDFIMQQSIEFDSYDIYGQLSNDGEYLITWDRVSKEIKIRKCQEL